MNISLPEQMKVWVEFQADNGQYSNSSDYIRDLIRHDQIQRNNQQALIEALLYGEQSGTSDIEALKKPRIGWFDNYQVEKIDDTLDDFLPDDITEEWEW